MFRFAEDGVCGNHLCHPPFFYLCVGWRSDHGDTGGSDDAWRRMYGQAGIANGGDHFDGVTNGAMSVHEPNPMNTSAATTLNGQKQPPMTISRNPASILPSRSLMTTSYH
jgi:hypothetical protein